MKNYIIRPEKQEDYREVENLIRESFWNHYQQLKNLKKVPKIKHKIYATS